MTESILDPIRTDPGRRRITVLAAGAVGVALASVHWLGIVAAGALVGILAPSPRRGLVWGVGVGVVILGVFLLQAAASGSLDHVLGAGQPIVVAVLIPLIAAPLGALVRALD